jgi:hypothetical protein
MISTQNHPSASFGSAAQSVPGSQLSQLKKKVPRHTTQLSKAWNGMMTSHEAGQLEESRRIEERAVAELAWKQEITVNLWDKVCSLIY